MDLREMGLTRREGVVEGPAPHQESEISGQPPAGKESTATWSKKKRGRRVRFDKEDPSCTE